MNDSQTRTDSFKARNIRNTAHLGFWTVAWVLTLALATFGPRFAWESNTAFTLLAVAGNLFMGAGMILANKRHIKGLDELQQKIQLEAMALALGVTLVGGLGYSVLDITNVILFDAEISHVIFLTSFTYMAGMFFGYRRYQ